MFKKIVLIALVVILALTSTASVVTVTEQNQTAKAPQTIASLRTLERSYDHPDCPYPTLPGCG